MITVTDDDETWINSEITFTQEDDGTWRAVVKPHPRLRVENVPQAERKAPGHIRIVADLR